MQGQYQEDSLGALDIGKEFAKSYFLPWERMKYDPTAWNLSRGGINVGELNPFRRGGLVNNSATRSAAKAGYNSLSGITKKFGWAGNLAGSETVQDIRSTVSKMRKGINLDFNTGVVQMQDGILSASTTRIRDSGWHSKLVERERGLLTKLRIAKADNVFNEGVEAFEKHMLKTNPLMASGPHLSTGTGNAVVKASGSKVHMVAGRATKANWGQKALTFGAARYSNEAALIGEIAATKGARFLGGVGTVVGKGAMRLGAAAGWASAMYQVGSLMYQGIKMVASPVAAAGVQAVDQTFNTLQQFANPEIGGQLEMGFVSQGAATERQRAVQAISKSRINGRSMLGSEGAMMHR